MGSHKTAGLRRSARTHRLRLRLPCGCYMTYMTLGVCDTPPARRRAAAGGRARVGARTRARARTAAAAVAAATAAAPALAVATAAAVAVAPSAAAAARAAVLLRPLAPLLRKDDG